MRQRDNDHLRKTQKNETNVKLHFTDICEKNKTTTKTKIIKTENKIKQTNKNDSNKWNK